MVGVHRIARKGLYLGSEAAELNSQVYWRKQSRRRDWRFLEDVGEWGRAAGLEALLWRM